MGENDRKCLAQSTINFPECILKTSWENIPHSWDRLSLSLRTLSNTEKTDVVHVGTRVYVEAPSRDNQFEYSPDPGVPSKGKMA